MRIKKELFDSLMEYQELMTGLTKGKLYEKYDLTYAVVSKARTGEDVLPQTVHRIARMLDCDPLDLVVEEDLPVLKKKRKKRGTGNEP